MVHTVKFIAMSHVLMSALEIRFLAKSVSIRTKAFQKAPREDLLAFILFG